MHLYMFELNAGFLVRTATIFELTVDLVHGLR